MDQSAVLTRTVDMAQYSSALQLLIDAEKPTRIGSGDALHLLAKALVAVGLVDYLKSGWYQTSAKGLVFASSSAGVAGFKLSLQHLTEQLIAKSDLLARPRRQSAKQRREADQLVWAAKHLLARLNARDEQEPASW